MIKLRYVFMTLEDYWICWLHVVDISCYPQNAAVQSTVGRTYLRRSLVVRLAWGMAKVKP